MNRLDKKSKEERILKATEAFRVLAFALLPFILGLLMTQSAHATFTISGGYWRPDGSEIYITAKSNGNLVLEMDFYRWSNVNGRWPCSLIGYFTVVGTTTWDCKAQISFTAYSCVNSRCIQAYSGSLSSINLCKAYLDQQLQMFFVQACSAINCWTAANYAQSLMSQFTQYGGYLLGGTTLTYIVYRALGDILPRLLPYIM